MIRFPLIFAALNFVALPYLWAWQGWGLTVAAGAFWSVIMLFCVSIITQEKKKAQAPPGVMFTSGAGNTSDTGDVWGEANIG